MYEEPVSRAWGFIDFQTNRSNTQALNKVLAPHQLAHVLLHAVPSIASDPARDEVLVSGLGERTRPQKLL